MMLKTDKSSCRIIWYFQLSMATVTSFKADILSITPSSEWGANTQNISYKTLYSSYFMLATQLKIPNYLVILSHRCSSSVSLETNPPLLKSSCGWPYSIYLCCHITILRQILLKYLKLWKLLFSLLLNTHKYLNLHSCYCFFSSHMPWFCQQPVMYMYMDKVMIFKLFFLQVRVNKLLVVFCSCNRMPVDGRLTAIQTYSQT